MSEPVPPGSEEQRPRLLYITFDGILEPLGRSQVLRYVRDLNRRGYRYTILSLERPASLANADEVARVAAEMEQSGIGWRRLEYRTGSLRNVISNVVRAFTTARRTLREEGTELVHARSYVAAAVALLLRITGGVPYIFDARGYWIDERAVEGRWFRNRVVYAAGKRMERWMMRRAAAVVTLTRIMAADLRSGMLRTKPDIPVVVIPTCTDYEVFRLREAEGEEAAPEDSVAARLHGRLVVGMVGSVNASYCVTESLQLFRELQLRKPAAHLLCVTQQVEALTSLVRAQGLEENAFTVVRVAHRDMPAWLRRMDWAFLMLYENFAKRGSMPTKLGELFASGVRPIQYGCNEEVREMVEQAGSGVVLRGLNEAELRRAAEAIAGKWAEQANDSERCRGELLYAREQTRPWFDVRAGVDKYDALLQTLVREGRTQA